MKKGKKILSLIMALLLAFSNAASVFAVELKAAEEIQIEENANLPEEEPVPEEGEGSAEFEAKTTLATVVASGYCGGEGDGTNLEWVLTNDGTLTISGSGKMADYAYSSSYGTTAPWGKYEYGLYKLVIENGVTSIGDYAFYSCENLTGNLVIPNSVTDIGITAFNSCNFTGNLVIPGSVKNIGRYAFRNTGFTGSLTIQKGVTTIGEYAFSNCYYLSGDLVLPEGLKTIGEGAFQWCGFNGKLVIPGTVTSIGYDAFFHCENLKGNLVLPENLTNIYKDTFYYCTGLSGDLVVPKNVTSIDASAFEKCGINSYYFKGNAPTVVASTAMSPSFEKNEDTIYYPEGNSTWIISGGKWNGYTAKTWNPDVVASGYCGGEGDGTNLEWMLTDDGTLTISGSGKMADYAYTPSYGTTAPWGKYRSKLKKLVIENGVTSIGARAFDGCTGFTGNLVLPNSVTSIGGLAFYACNFTGNLVIPDSVTSIGEDAFYGCDSITKIQIGAGTNYIGAGAFASCDDLEEISVSSNNKTYSSYAGALYTKDGETVVQYPAGKTSLLWKAGVKKIGDYAFAGCTKLTGELRIPDTVTSIRDSAFAWCTGFTGNLVLPESLTSIGGFAFAWCDGFTGNLVIPNSVTSIGASAFYGCDGFTGNLVISDSVITIWGSAFYGCTGFTGNLVLPKSLTSIGYSAFNGCGINEYYFKGNAPSSNFSFDTTDTIYYPAGNDTWVIENGKWNGYAAKAWYPPLASGKCGTNLSWVLSNDGTLTISGSGAMEDYASVFDSTTGENRTTAPWQAYESKVKSLVIGEGATSIGEFAFYNFDGIKGSLTLPKSLKTIGNSAFAGCSGFSGTLTIPDSVTTISSSAFRGCSGLTGLKLGSKVATIGNTAFRNCAGIKGSITIPASVTEIGNFTFRDTGITAVYFEGNAPKVSAGNETNSSFGSNVTVYYDNAFSGWNIDSAGKWCGYKTATWQNPTVTRYTVSYNANGGSGAPASQSKAKGVDLTLSTVQPTRSGYTFMGWATSSTGSVKYAPGAKYTTDANVTLYAVWEKVLATYTVIYNANGGENAPESQTKTEGVALTLSTVVPTRSGYTFMGWATSSTGSVKYTPGAKYTTDANVTLYAVWEKVPVTPSESATITVFSVSAKAGDTVEVPVKISGNPGFASVQMRVVYDKSVLILKEIKLGLADNCVSSVATGNIAGASASDITGDGTLFTLVFSVSEDAEVGSYEVDINVLEFYNASDKKIDVTVLSGTVEVADYIPGDANGDGVVSSRDATAILRYLVDSSVNSVDLAAADYNGDGSVSSRDATAILRFLIGA